MKPDEQRFSDKLTVKVPSRVSPLIETAAARKCMTASEYIRRSVIDRLESEGFSLAEAV